MPSPGLKWRVDKLSALNAQTGYGDQDTHKPPVCISLFHGTPTFALNEGLLLARENATVSKRALSKYTRVDDDAALQGSFDFYKSAFSSTLRIVEKAMANALRFIDHPKAKQADVKQFYDNSLVDEAMK